LEDFQFVIDTAVQCNVEENYEALLRSFLRRANLEI
jgi:hypothetical protein